MNQIVPINANVEAYRASTDAANLCKEIVSASSSNIQGKRYVSVEGWEAIARAHGCAAGATNVRRVDGGVAATGEVRDMFSGNIIATGEGFVGEDEAVWFGGEVTDKWGKTKVHQKRADYAIRAMAQTRAISRACRSAFAHVVVMMNAGLSTTPAEEVPHDGFDDSPEPPARTKLDGPHTSKTALRTAVHAIVATVRAAQSSEDIDAIQKEHIATIRQANADWPILLTGDPDIEEDVGLRGVIEQRRAELDTDSAVNVAIDSMKQCEDRVQLETWMEGNAPALEALDGADSRRFQASYDQFEAGLAQVAALQAG